MKRPVLLSSPEMDAVELLGRRLRHARIRRGLSQDDIAERTGVTRKTVVALEQGRETVNIGLLVKTLSVLGYLDRLPDILASDPIGEDLEDIHGRKRAPRVEG